MYHIFCPIDNYYCWASTILLYMSVAAAAALCLFWLHACALTLQIIKLTSIMGPIHTWCADECELHALLSRVLLLYISICSHLRSIVQSTQLGAVSRAKWRAHSARHSMCRARIYLYNVRMVLVLLGPAGPKAARAALSERKGSLLELQIASV